VSDFLSGLGTNDFVSNTDFYRAVGGLRGSCRILDLGAFRFYSQDYERLESPNTINPSAAQAALNSTDPATALNPFIATQPGTAQLLHSLVFNEEQKNKGNARSVASTLRGPLFDLPAGTVQLAVGAEYERDTLYTDYVNNPFFPPNDESTFSRGRDAAGVGRLQRRSTSTGTVPRRPCGAAISASC